MLQRACWLSSFSKDRLVACSLAGVFQALSSVVPLAAPAIGAAQTPWPSRPIRWIVNFPPAGAADILSRTLAEWFGSRLGQPIVVENKPGAGGLLGADIVAKARGDTHLVMMSSAASHGIGPVLYKDVPYDPLADFTHIHLVGTFPSVLAVNGTLAITNVQQLIELARSKPGEVTYGSGGNGTMNHLVGQLLALSAKVQLTHIPYRGSAPAMNDLMGGQIMALMESLPTAIGYFNSGRMRPLAVSEAKDLPRSPTPRHSAKPDFPMSSPPTGSDFRRPPTFRARSRCGGRRKSPRRCRAPRSRTPSPRSASGPAPWVRPAIPI